jgi:3,4-dihydroxy 2-butanone 4-phosphate synthase/GTP cyclohydrolase II
LKRIVVSRLPTRLGNFDIYGYQVQASGIEHVALVSGRLPLPEPVLVRIQSECLTGEVFGSLRCDCRAQLDLALHSINAAGGGVLVYLRGHEGRGIGLLNKLRAYALQDHGSNTVHANRELGLPVDARDYSAAAAILRDLGLRTLRLMTNNPDKVHAMQSAGLTVTERVPIVSRSTPENAEYLRTKEEEMGHLLGGAAPRGPRR